MVNRGLTNPLTYVIIPTESEVNEMKEKEMTPRQVCELFFKLFNEYGYFNIKKVFESAEKMYFEIEGEFE